MLLYAALSHAMELSTDERANYIVQKLADYATPLELVDMCGTLFPQVGAGGCGCGCGCGCRRLCERAHGVAVWAAVRARDARVGMAHVGTGQATDAEFRSQCLACKGTA